MEPSQLEQIIVPLPDELKRLKSIIPLEFHDYVITASNANIYKCKSGLLEMDLLELSFRNELYLNLVMEYVPETVYRVLKHYSNMNQRMPLLYVKLYTYQIFRGLAYIHIVPRVCHRDVKPQNLLLDPHTHDVKLCDFESAKNPEPESGPENKRALHLYFANTLYSIALIYYSNIHCIFLKTADGREGTPTAVDPPEEEKFLGGIAKSLKPHKTVHLSEPPHQIVKGIYDQSPPTSIPQKFISSNGPSEHFEIPNKVSKINFESTGRMKQIKLKRRLYFLKSRTYSIIKKQLRKYEKNFILSYHQLMLSQGVILRRMKKDGNLRVGTKQMGMVYSSQSKIRGIIFYKFIPLNGVLYKPHFEQLFKEHGNFRWNFHSPLTKSVSKLTPELAGRDGRYEVHNIFGLGHRPTGDFKGIMQALPPRLIGVLQEKAKARPIGSGWIRKVTDE
ncbi:hypothetical protein IFM89_008796 [Coptis chinensis]|uniref:Protein kinase domain-containing protein n=1 Tax=Coptis chinensis TaxID=261450 RepID=A0A835GWZ0_9MAGN|nr:hypothetical protein IFM89_008796 [Coptis chinensis]